MLCRSLRLTTAFSVPRPSLKLSLSASLPPHTSTYSDVLRPVALSHLLLLRYSEIVCGFWGEEGGKEGGEEGEADGG